MMVFIHFHDMRSPYQSVTPYGLAAWSSGCM
jgi:hypothetical protein